MSKFKALIDGRVFENNFQRGIQRYLYEVLRRINIPFSILLGRPTTVEFQPNWHIIQKSEYGTQRDYNFVLNAYWRLLRLRSQTKYNSYGVYHTPYYGISPSPAIPTVLVINDLIYELHRHQYPGSKRLAGSFISKSVPKADAFIAISESTRQDFARCYPCYADRTTVVHPGSEHLCYDMADKPNSALLPDGLAAKLNGPYALFVGDRAFYKNFRILPAAMVESTWPKELLLAVVGKDFSREELAAIKTFSLERRIVHLGRVDDATLKQIYRGSSVFVFPSLIEGFGIPLIEAQSAGVPVAASDIRVFHEVGGPAFQPFNPNDPDSVARAVALCIEPETSSRLITLGRNNINRFSWSDAAEKTLDVWTRTLRTREHLL